MDEIDSDSLDSLRGITADKIHQKYYNKPLDPYQHVKAYTRSKRCFRSISFSEYHQKKVNRRQEQQDCGFNSPVHANYKPLGVPEVDPNRLDVRQNWEVYRQNNASSDEESGHSDREDSLQKTNEPDYSFFSAFGTEQFDNGFDVLKEHIKEAAVRMKRLKAGIPFSEIIPEHDFVPPPLSARRSDRPQPRLLTPPVHMVYEETTAASSPAAAGTAKKSMKAPMIPKLALSSPRQLRTMRSVSARTPTKGSSFGWQKMTVAKNRFEPSAESAREYRNHPPSYSDAENSFSPRRSAPHPHSHSRHWAKTPQLPGHSAEEHSAPGATGPAEVLAPSVMEGVWTYPPLNPTTQMGKLRAAFVAEIADRTRNLERKLQELDFERRRSYRVKFNKMTFDEFLGQPAECSFKRDMEIVRLESARELLVDRIRVQRTAYRWFGQLISLVTDGGRYVTATERTLMDHVAFFAKSGVPLTKEIFFALVKQVPAPELSTPEVYRLLNFLRINAVDISLDEYTRWLQDQHLPLPPQLQQHPMWAALDPHNTAFNPSADAHPSTSTESTRDTVAPETGLGQSNFNAWPSHVQQQSESPRLSDASLPTSLSSRPPPS